MAPWPGAIAQDPAAMQMGIGRRKGKRMYMRYGLQVAALLVARPSSARRLTDRLILRACKKAVSTADK